VSTSSELAEARLVELARKYDEGNISCGELWELITKFAELCESLMNAVPRRDSEERRRLEPLLLASTYRLNILVVHYSMTCALRELAEKLQQQLERVGEGERRA
jgi:hypothetical protein